LAGNFKNWIEGIVMTVPAWVKETVFYQIFPDRFANGDSTNDPPNTQTWGTPPTIWGFQGGDFRGIIQHFDYLLDLGVNGLYLNPIFQATSNHRYNTTDYFKIDPKLGTLKDFKEFLYLAQSQNVRVILDGVFNHCGRGFFAFNDLLENQEQSPYRDWFHILKFPINAYGQGEDGNYLSWWNIKSLPKFNTSNPMVRQYILDVARYWVEQGIDGWRLDVPNEINDDDFWGEFRDTVKSVNPGTYLFGEIWEQDPRWVSPGHFDGLMNYPVRRLLIDWLNKKITTTRIAEGLENNINSYPLENSLSMYVPLGSHDTERILTILGSNLDKLKVAMLFLFAFPGSPAIYYGDEIGMEGGKDPDCRRAFPWDGKNWKHEVHELVRRLITLRKGTPALSGGAYVPLYFDEHTKCLCFKRIKEGQIVAVFINPGSSSQKIKITSEIIGWSNNCEVMDLLSLKKYQFHEGILNLLVPSRSACWLTK
jgi:cyclomaltodextrinase / maltogenic alpha-amylase / neopullulanase